MAAKMVKILKSHISAKKYDKNMTKIVFYPYKIISGIVVLLSCFKFKMAANIFDKSHIGPKYM